MLFLWVVVQLFLHVTDGAFGTNPQWNQLYHAIMKDDQTGNLNNSVPSANVSPYAFKNDGFESLQRALENEVNPYRNSVNNDINSMRTGTDEFPLENENTFNTAQAINYDFNGNSIGASNPTYMYLQNYAGHPYYDDVQSGNLLSNDAHMGNIITASSGSSVSVENPYAFTDAYGDLVQPLASDSSTGKAIGSQSSDVAGNNFGSTYDPYYFDTVSDYDNDAEKIDPYFFKQKYKPPSMSLEYYIKPSAPRSPFNNNIEKGTNFPLEYYIIPAALRFPFKNNIAAKGTNFYSRPTPGLNFNLNQFPGYQPYIYNEQRTHSPDYYLRLGSLPKQISSYTTNTVLPYNRRSIYSSTDYNLTPGSLPKGVSRASSAVVQPQDPYLSTGYNVQDAFLPKASESDTLTEQSYGVPYSLNKGAYSLNKGSFPPNVHHAQITNSPDYYVPLGSLPNGISTYSSNTVLPYRGRYSSTDYNLTPGSLPKGVSHASSNAVQPEEHYSSTDYNDHAAFLPKASVRGMARKYSKEGPYSSNENPYYPNKDSYSPHDYNGISAESPSFTPDRNPLYEGLPLWKETVPLDYNTDNIYDTETTKGNDGDEIQLLNRSSKKDGDIIKYSLKTSGVSAPSSEVAKINKHRSDQAERITKRVLNWIKQRNEEVLRNPENHGQQLKNVYGFMPGGNQRREGPAKPLRITKKGNGFDYKKNITPFKGLSYKPHYSGWKKAVEPEFRSLLSLKLRKKLQRFFPSVDLVEPSDKSFSPLNHDLNHQEEAKRFGPKDPFPLGR